MGTPTRGSRGWQGSLPSPGCLRSPSVPRGRGCHGSPSCPARRGDGSGSGREMSPIPGADGPPRPRGLPALPVLPSALSGMRSAEGSVVSGHVPSMGTCGTGTRGTGTHGTETWGPAAGGTYRVSGGTWGSRWPRGTILARVSLEITGVEREAELLALLPAHLIPGRVLLPGCSATTSRHPRAWSWDLTWGPPSPLHPGVPGSGLLLPGGPWGAERGLSEPPSTPWSPRAASLYSPPLREGLGAPSPPGHPGSLSAPR